MTGETIKRLSLEKRRRVEVISNGVPPASLGMSHNDGGYILYLGRIDIYGKGLDLLIKAYREVCRQFPEARLVIAGTGKDIEEFEAMLSDLPENARKKVQLAGWLEGEKKTETIRRASFLVFPSRHEVQPIAVLEALAQGKAVVVSDIPGFSFVTENGAGISFESGNKVSLAASMIAMLTASAEGKSEMEQRGRDWVSEFTWDKIAERFEKFLYSVVDKQ